MSERTRPACADGLDNDDDGAIDYPLDDGCASALDNDETEAVVGVDAGMPGVDAGSDPDAAANADSSIPPDAGFEIAGHGGVDSPSGGCGCSVENQPSHWAIWIVLAGWVWRRRRARR